MASSAAPRGRVSLSQTPAKEVMGGLLSALKDVGHQVVPPGRPESLHGQCPAGFPREAGLAPTESLVPIFLSLCPACVSPSPSLPWAHLPLQSLRMCSWPEAAPSGSWV